MREKIDNDDPGRLPEELWLQVFSLLEKRDLANSRLACTFFNRVTKDKSLEFYYPPLDFSTLSEENSTPVVTIEGLEESGSINMVSLNNDTIAINAFTKLAVVKFKKDLKPEIIFLEPKNNTSYITAFSKISEDLVACSYSDGIVRIWDIPAEKCLSNWTPQIFPSETRLDLRKKIDFLIATKAGILVYGKKKSLHFYNLSNNTPIHSIDLSEHYNNEFEYTEGMCLDNNEQVVTITHQSGHFRRTNCLLYTWNMQGKLINSQLVDKQFGCNQLLFFNESVNTTEITRLINMKASWDFKQQTSNCQAEKNDLSNGMNKLCSVVNRDTLAICLSNNPFKKEPDKLTLWDINTGKCITRFSHDNIRTIVVMPDQRIIILGGQHGNELYTLHFQPLFEAQEASAEQSSYVP